MANKTTLPEPTTKELQDRVLKSDESVKQLLMTGVIIIVLFVICSLSYLVVHQIHSENELKQIIVSNKSINQKQSEELNSIKKNQTTNSAIYKSQFAAIEAILQQQNSYLKCLTTMGGPECIQPVFPADSINSPNTPQTQPETAQNSPQPSPAPTPPASQPVKVLGVQTCIPFTHVCINK